MDVSPMSMQMIVPRATEVGQVQHNLNQASALQQDFQAVQQKADDKLKQKQVRTKSNPEDGRIKDDQKRGGQGGYNGSGQRHSAEAEDSDEEVMAFDPLRGRHLDITT